MRILVILSAVVIGISALVVLQGGGSEAAWPGQNGRIVYQDLINGGIWIMNADGSERQPVTTGFDSNPSWSPDGSKIAFERLVALPDGGPGGQRAIWTVDPEGSDATQVVIGSQPSFSPGSKRIVFTRDGWIREINADGTGEVQITSNPAFFDTAPVYRSDGSLIAFLRGPFLIVVGRGPGVSGGAAAADIWTTTPDGLGQLRITDTPLVSEGPPDWSPNGDRLTHTDNTGLVVRTLPANAPQTILAEIPGTIPRNPVFSPGGTTIAFTRVEFTIVLGEGAGVGPAGGLSVDTISTIPAAGGTATVVPGSVINPAEETPDWEPVPPATPTPSPTLSPTPTEPAEGTVVDVPWGDDNCSGEPNPIDSLLTLLTDAGELLPNPPADCPRMNDVVMVFATSGDDRGIAAGGSAEVWGDVDCSGSITPVDSLKILRFDAGFTVAQPLGCPAIGDVVTVEYTP